MRGKSLQPPRRTNRSDQGRQLHLRLYGAHGATTGLFGAVMDIVAGSVVGQDHLTVRQIAQAVIKNDQ
ncbi:MAG: hypothetical protein LBH68_06615 [Bifidobacteriaceae bacterium]|nr:hypothetical protein [Bifidobacteriaceae bacterium]